jgi:hypothetical protein
MVWLMIGLAREGTPAAQGTRREALLKQITKRVRGAADTVNDKVL